MNILKSLLKWSGADQDIVSAPDPAQDFTNYVEAEVLSTMSHAQWGDVDILHYFNIGFYEFAVCHDDKEKIRVVMTLELRPIPHERASLTTHGA